MGRVYKRQAQYDKALSLTLQSKTILEKEYGTIHHSSIAKSNDNLGDIYFDQGQIEKAIKAYQQGLFSLIPNFQTSPISNNPNSSAHNIQDKQTALTLLSSKAKAFQALAKTKDPKTQLLNALYTYETLDTLITEIRLSYQAAGSKYHLAEKTTPIYGKAIEVALQLHQLTGQGKYWEKAYYFGAKNKAIILLEGMQEEAAQKYSDIPSMDLEREQSLKKEVSDLTVALYDAQTEKQDSLVQIYQDALFEKKSAYRTLKRQFEEEYPKYYELKYGFQSPLTVQTIQNSLADDQLLIEYFWGESQLITFVISKNDRKQYTLPLPANFQDTCLVYRQLLNIGDEVDKKKLLQLSYYLYQKLLEKPLLDFSAKDTIRRLVIIPDNRLLQISFDALLTEPTTDWQEKSFLVYKYATGIAYSNQLIFDSNKNRRIKEAIEDFVGFGLEYSDYTLEGINNPSEKTDTLIKNRAIGRLPYADEEAIEVASLYNTRAWVNHEATLPIFLEHAPKGKILHFSGHGIVNEISPLNSALVFSRESEQAFLLRASDLYHTPLSADLAVLSACNTGAGNVQKGEGVRSLARAFNYAGCPSLIASLWNASDFTTKEIILNFYRALQQGLPKDIALQKAKIAYLKSASPEQTNPFFWSHLTLIGDSTPIELATTNWFDYWWVLLLILLFVGVRNRINR